MGISESVISNTTKSVFDAYYDIVNSLVATEIAKGTLLSSTSQSIQSSSCGPDCYSQYNVKTLNDCIITDYTINQSSDTRNQLQGISMSTVIENVKTNLATQTENYINNITKTHADWGTIAINVVLNSNTTVTKISADIANSVSTNTQTICKIESSENQEVKILLCGIVKNVDITQSAFQTNTMSCIAKQIAKFVASNGVITKAITQANDSTSTGSNYLIYGIIGIVLVIIVFIIVGALSGKSTPDKPVAGSPADSTGTVAPQNTTTTPVTT